jgi:ribose transport system substrate-binding protein
MGKGDESRYFVEMAARTLDVLESFDSYEEELTIREVARRVDIPYTCALRLLYTLARRGYVTRCAGSKRYVRTPSRRRFRIGYASLDHKIRFSEEVSHSMALAARSSGVDLLVKDNALSPQIALANADFFIDEKVDLLIDHQLDETAAHLISAKCHQANIPVIAINFAQPGAYYFGGNNYLAGLLSGHYLCGFIKNQWKGKFDKLLVLRAKGMGSTQEVRRTGICDIFKKQFGRVLDQKIIDGPPGITAQDGYHATKRIFGRAGMQSARTVICVMSDALAIGCSRAVQEMDLVEQAVIVGHGGARDGRIWLRRGSAPNALVAYFPETYGERVIAQALSILNGDKVPLISYTNHVVLTKANLDQYYSSNRAGQEL